MNLNVVILIIRSQLFNYLIIIYTFSKKKKYITFMRIRLKIFLK